MKIESLFLPTSLEVGGTDFQIRTDYRDILRIIFALNDPDLDDREKARVLLTILYIDYKNLPNLEEAIEKAMWFISCGDDDSKNGTGEKLIDWEHDISMIIPPVNRVANRDVRSPEPMHWWTFIGYYSEIGECHFSQMFSIRYKKKHGKKLEKWEQEIYSRHKDEIDLPVRLNEEERESIPEWARSLIPNGN